MEAATDGERLARIEALLEGMGATLADVRMEQHRTAERIGRLDERIDRVDGRIDGLNRRIDRALEQREGMGRWRLGHCRRRNSGFDSPMGAPFPRNAAPAINSARRPMPVVSAEGLPAAGRLMALAG